jgi:probable F420-dependent oxidoreductase
MAPRPGSRNWPKAGPYDQTLATAPTRLSVRVGVGLPPGAPGADPSAALWGLVGTLEEVGYDSIWLSDSAARGGLAPLPTLAAIAARTGRLKLGTNVLVMPPRNPLTLAREMATVDALSAGRLLPAGGLGVDLPRELEALGVRREERAARLEESVAIVKALWGGEPVSYEGDFWQLHDMTLAPRPRRPRLELWLGGRAPAAMRRIGRIADGWLGSFIGAEEFGAKVDLIRDSAAAAGRRIDEDHYGTTIWSAPEEAEVPASIAALLDRRAELPREEHLAIGTGATGELLERFLAVGATKFVLIPLAADPEAWLRELFPRVIEPLETAGVVRQA